MRHAVRENNLEESVAPGKALEDGRIGLTWRRCLCEAEVRGGGHEHAVANSFGLFRVARLEQRRPSFQDEEGCPRRWSPARRRAPGIGAAEALIEARPGRSAVAGRKRRASVRERSCRGRRHRVDERLAGAADCGHIDHDTSSPTARSSSPREPTPLRLEMPRFRDQLARFLNLGLAALPDLAVGRRHLNDGRFDRKRVLDRSR